MKRHEVINRMWNAAKECIEACNADGKCALTFFALLEKCKSKVPEIAVSADIQDVNLGEALFYSLLREWLMLYDPTVFYVTGFSDVAYMLLKHLFEEEDFTQVFTSAGSLMNCVLSLKSNEIKVCSLYNEREQDFIALYKAIASRTQISLVS